MLRRFGCVCERECKHHRMSDLRFSGPLSAGSLVGAVIQMAAALLRRCIYHGFLNPLGWVMATISSAAGANLVAKDMVPWASELTTADAWRLLHGLNGQSRCSFRCASGIPDLAWHTMPGLPDSRPVTCEDLAPFIWVSCISPLQMHLACGSPRDWSLAVFGHVTGWSFTWTCVCVCLCVILSICQTLSFCPSVCLCQTLSVRLINCLSSVSVTSDSCSHC